MTEVTRPVPLPRDHVHITQDVGNCRQKHIITRNSECKTWPGLQDSVKAREVGRGAGAAWQ